MTVVEWLMGDEYRYRVSMKCDTHGNIHGYLYCPECTIASLRAEVERLREAVEWALRVKDTIEEPFDFKDELRRRAEEPQLPCPHARPSWKQCPHCLGVNEAAKEGIVK